MGVNWLKTIVFSQFSFAAVAGHYEVPANRSRSPLVDVPLIRQLCRAGGSSGVGVLNLPENILWGPELIVLLIWKTT